MNAPEAVAAIEANLEEFLLNFCRLPETRVYQSPEMIQFVANVPVGMFNCVPRTRLREEWAQAQVAAATARYAAFPVPACWWITPASRPANLARHLEQNGWTATTSWRGMAMEIAFQRGGSRPPEDVRVQAVHDPESLCQWVRVFQRGFGASASVSELLLQAWEGAVLPFTLFLAYTRDHTPVATALLQHSAQVAGIYCVATVPEARRRGIGTLITRHVLEHARAAGCTHAIVQSTEMGRDLYRRLGFAEYCRIRMFERD